MANIIETFDLTKRFSKATNYRALLRLNRQETLTAVNAVNLQVREGELFGLLGANGAGKTTLIKILCTLILPTEGRAVVAGYDVVKEATPLKSLIGLVDTNERSFFWRLTGQQNLEFFASLQGLRGPAAKKQIADLLDLVGLTTHASRRFMGYSSGMKQKLAVARGLLTQPKIIFLDEPTRSLDPVSANELRTFVSEKLVKERGHTVILVTHRLEEAENLCDRVAIMKDGLMIDCGPVAYIKQQVTARQRYYLRLQGLTSADLSEVERLPGVVQLESTVDDDHITHLDVVLADERQVLPSVLALIVQRGGQIQHCQPKRVSLEEAFVELVKR